MVSGFIACSRPMASRATSLIRRRLPCLDVTGAPRPMRSMAKRCCALMAWQRGEPRVCAMTVPPSPSEEDRRRITRERAKLLQERIRHTNRIRGLLFGQGITNYNPLHKNRRKGLEELRTGDGRSVPAHLKSEILREIDRLELVLRQIGEVEAERDEMLQLAQASSPAALLMRL